MQKKKRKKKEFSAVSKMEYKDKAQRIRTAVYYCCCCVSQPIYLEHCCLTTYIKGKYKYVHSAGCLLIGSQIVRSMIHKYTYMYIYTTYIYSDVLVRLYIYCFYVTTVGTQITLAGGREIGSPWASQCTGRTTCNVVNCSVYCGSHPCHSR